MLHISKSIYTFSSVTPPSWVQLQFLHIQHGLCNTTISQYHNITKFETLKSLHLTGLKFSLLVSTERFSLTKRNDMHTTYQSRRPSLQHRRYTLDFGLQRHSLGLCQVVGGRLVVQVWKHKKHHYIQSGHGQHGLKTIRKSAQSGINLIRAKHDNCTLVPHNKYKQHIPL